MTITPEQFNKLATKEDLREMEEKFVTKDEFREFKGDVLGALDTVVKKLDTIEHAFVSNQAVHDRFERRLERLEKHLNLEPIFS